MRIFNKQLLYLNYKSFGNQHLKNALLHFIVAVLCVWLAHFIYHLLRIPEQELDFIAIMFITTFCVLIAVQVLYIIILIIQMSKQKRLEKENIILQTIQPIDAEFGNKLFYRLSKLYQLYNKRIKNNKYVNNSIGSLFSELDNQLYDTLISLKNLKSIDKEQLQLLEMNDNPIYLKLYKEIILKEEIEQMEKCFNEFQYSFPYYALHNVNSMIMTLKNNEINTLLEYEQMENDIWKILDSIKQKCLKSKY